MTPLKLVQHGWQHSDLIGGHRAIDFANTVSGWGTDNEDWLTNYAGLAKWAHLAGLIDELEYKKAIKAAVRNPLIADRIYAEASELRFAFLRLLHAVKDGASAMADDLIVVNRWIRHAAEAFQLRQVSRTFRQDWSANTPILEKPLLAAARAVGLFLEGTDFDKLKICALPTCGWFFIDVSKNGRRRWCDMAVCGNLAKARRFQARRRGDRASRR